VNNQRVAGQIGQSSKSGSARPAKSAEGAVAQMIPPPTSPAPDLYLAPFDLATAAPASEDAARMLAVLAVAAPTWLRQDRIHLGAPSFLWDGFMAGLDDGLDQLLDHPDAVEAALVECWRTWRSGWIQSEWCVG
jgi:hypothetical protein